MRVKNTKVKFIIPIPINKPDTNGVIYTEDAIKNALNNFRPCLPIVYKEDMDSDEMVIGATGASNIATWDFENQICNVEIDGVIFYSGADIVVNEITEDGKVSDFKIVSVGLST